MSLEVDVFLLTFSFVVFIALLIPELIRRFHLTPVPVFIIAGIAVGPHGLGLIEIHPAIYDIGRLGLFFLVFLAGLEVYASKGSESKRFVILTIISGTTCFLAGYMMATLFGFPSNTAFLFGAILVSSSVGEIIPMITANYHLRERVGTYIIPAVVTLDTVSLVMLSMVLRFDQSALEVVFFTGLAIIFIVTSYILIPEIAKWFFGRYEKRPQETETRFVLTILFYFVAISTLLGIHGIVAAFIAGIILGESLKAEGTIRKMEGIGYGFLIPIFFINIGLETDLSILMESTAYIWLVIAVIGTLMISKIVSGVLFAKITNRGLGDGIATGIVLWPQLSATLAATEIGRQANIIPEDLFVAIVLMAITTAIGTPFVVGFLYGKRRVTIPYENHIVVIGAGRTGGDVLKEFTDTDHDLLTVDRNMERIREWRYKWVACIYGDAEEPQVLENAAIDSAKLVIITVGTDRATVNISREVREMNPDVKMIVKVQSSDAKVMLEDIVDVFIEPEHVTAFNIMWHAYCFLDHGVAKKESDE